MIFPFAINPINLMELKNEMVEGRFKMHPPILIDAQEGLVTIKAEDREVISYLATALHKHNIKYAFYFGSTYGRCKDKIELSCEEWKKAKEVISF